MVGDARLEVDLEGGWFVDVRASAGCCCADCCCASWRRACVLSICLAALGIHTLVVLLLV